MRTAGDKYILTIAILKSNLWDKMGWLTFLQFYLPFAQIQLIDRLWSDFSSHVPSLLTSIGCFVPSLKPPMSAHWTNIAPWRQHGCTAVWGCLHFTSLNVIGQVSPDSKLPWRWPGSPVVTSVTPGIGEESLPHFLQGLAVILVFPWVSAPAGDTISYISVCLTWTQI